MTSLFIKSLALVSILGLFGARVVANEPAAAAHTAEHAEHKDHKHIHGSKDCKHKKEQHGDHEDYEHSEGKGKDAKVHHHKMHDGHADECDNSHT